MNEAEQDIIFPERASTRVDVSIPDDVLATLHDVAAHRDMSLEALLRLYIGSGLRGDLARFYQDDLVLAVERVLETEGMPEEQVGRVIREIRDQVKEKSARSRRAS